MSQNRIYINDLLDLYEGLLTDRQRRISSDYYRNDLSISEISENEEITRSAVHDTLKHVETDLLHYEAVLGNDSARKKRLRIYDAMLSHLQQTDALKADIQQAIETESEGGNYE